VRVGELDGKLYLDLCDGSWRAVEIDATGWRVADRPAIRFRRSSDTRALPEPERDGSVDDLRKLLNIPDGAVNFTIASSVFEPITAPNGFDAIYGNLGNVPRGVPPKVQEHLN
jgi:hypothetical protein